MGIGKYILAGIVTSVLGSSGFMILEDSRRRAEESKMETTLKGYPISCENVIDRYLVAMVKNEEGKYVLCKGSRSAGYGLPILEATALIKSEIDDGDEESVELRGVYGDNEFEI